jgi:ABC-type transporter Mla MlaB component
MESWVFGRYPAQVMALREAESPLRVAFTRPPPTLRLAGEIDESTYAELCGVLALAVATGERQLRVDLGDVEYCDLAGLRAIVSLAPVDSTDCVDAGSAVVARVEQLVLRHVPAQLQDVIRILGWDARPGLFVDLQPC